MSLLLEALKKAELAKHGASKAAAAPAPEPEPAPEAARATTSAPPFSLELEPSAAVRVTTRENLPDISQPREILSEDLPSARRAEPGSEFEPLAMAAPASAPDSSSSSSSSSASASAPAPAPAPAAARARVSAPAAARARPEAEPFASDPEPEIAAERDAARQLFEAKEVDYNPRRPFYITLGVMGVIAVGYGFYVWWQMQPHYSYSAAAVANAPKAPPPQTAQPGAPAPLTAPAPTAGTPGAPAAAGPSTPAPPALASAAPAGPAAKPAAAPEPAPAKAGGPVIRRTGTPTEEPPPAPAAGARAPAAASRTGARARAPIAITPPSLAVDPTLERAWDAFQQGDLANAREAWQQMLKREPNNRDALLGLAAIEVRARDFEAADARYQRLLELDPRDSLALAGLISLRGQIDPVQAESRIKSLIANQPDATHLYFTLGNQYAVQGRWAEAQQAYFKAYSADPENADFAFNLAVSLDQLHQRGPAIEYYQRALVLTEKRPAGFDRSQVGVRVQALQRP